MKILIANEKYGTRIFDASTPEAMDKACRMLLDERFQKGWYEPGQRSLDPLIPLIDVPQGPDVSVAAINAIKDKNSQIETRNKETNKGNRCIRESIEFYNDVIRCLASERRMTKLGNTWSYLLLQNRVDHEYETVELTDIDEPTEVDKSNYTPDRLIDIDPQHQGNGQ